MSRFAERNPKLWSILEKVSIVVLGSLAFWLALLPVVTAPAAITALFAAVGPLVRGRDEDGFSLYWQAFRTTFGRSLLLGFLDLLLGLLFYLDLRFFWGLGTPVGKAAAYFLGAPALLGLMINFYAWPLLAWYPQPLGPLLKRSFLLAAAHPFAALVGWIAVGGAILILLLVPGQWLFILPVVGPGAVVAILGGAAWFSMRRYAGDDEQVESGSGGNDQAE